MRNLIVCNIYKKLSSNPKVAECSTHITAFLAFDKNDAKIRFEELAKSQNYNSKKYFVEFEKIGEDFNQKSINHFLATN